MKTLKQKINGSDQLNLDEIFRLICDETGADMNYVENWFLDNWFINKDGDWVGHEALRLDLVRLRATGINIAEPIFTPLGQLYFVERIRQKLKTNDMERS